ncbi:MAG: hydroxymethylglutaryl-CoA lyase [Clostridium sp.]|nr:hydroxymethylglutaryl-CoA lyase [Clostridium sp.]
MERQSVEIYEVGPRDGFQNLKEYIPMEDKLHYIGGLIEAGVKHIQITSFVSPRAIPQMMDARELAGECLARYPETDLFSLVPNLFGAKSAWESGIKKTSYVISLSESHNKANINRTREQSLEELWRIREFLPELTVISDIATAFACPFEGVMELDNLLELIRKINLLGINEFVLCDTIGMAHPAQVREYVKAAMREFPGCRFQVHIHDTRNMGIVNTLAAIECGVEGVQTTLGGLGGCPFAPGASGNTSTEDLVYMLNKMGYDTGIDFNRLLALAKEEYASIRGAYSGHHINIGSQCAV